MVSSISERPSVDWVITLLSTFGLCAVRTLTFRLLAILTHDPALMPTCLSLACFNVLVTQTGGTASHLPAGHFTAFRSQHRIQQLQVICSTPPPPLCFHSILFNFLLFFTFYFFIVFLHFSSHSFPLLYAPSLTFSPPLLLLF